MASVGVRDIRKAFGATHEIHGVDIAITGRELVVLVGPSGRRKSTLLRMIVGLENISGGERGIGERAVNHVPPKERAIVRDPQVVPFDEPLSNLDVTRCVPMRSEIKELHQRLKTSAVYVTHDGIVEQIGTRLIPPLPASMTC